MTKEKQNSQKEVRETVGFGVPVTTSEYFPHYFRVNIPRATRSPVLITEDLGELDDTKVDRAIVPRSFWTEISGPVQREFNNRLTANKVARGKWKVGDNPVYNLLGKELCVLAWAIEDAKKEQVGDALRNWLSLRPEERWWLFGMAASTAGGLEHKGMGWRKALKAALAETPFSQRTPISRGSPRRHSEPPFQHELLLPHIAD